MSARPTAAVVLAAGAALPADVVTPPSNLSYDAIRCYAEQVGRAHDIYDPVGHADIDHLVSALGGQVRTGDSPVSLLIHGKGDFEIFTTSCTSARRRRFAAAHEIGHYFLH